jgi:hypothetical protein
MRLNSNPCSFVLTLVTTFGMFDVSEFVSTPRMTFLNLLSGDSGQGAEAKILASKA